MIEQPSEIERERRIQKAKRGRKNTPTDARLLVADRQEVIRTAGLTSSNLAPLVRRAK